MASGSQGNHSGGEARHPSVLIALMGETGVGKTSFARRVTGDDSIQFNSSLTPERAGAVRAYSLWLTSRDGGRRYHVTLIDCAGFDSIEEPDAAIINAIVDHLNVTYSRDQKLHGIIYTLDITQTRVTHGALANMSMFKRLVGDEYYPNVVLGTTFWDSLGSIAHGERREAKLIQEDAFWGQLYRRGSKIRRLAFDSVLNIAPRFNSNAIFPIGDDEDILLDICDNHRPLALCVQKEMAGGVDREQTSALMELNDWKELARQYQERKRRLEEQIRAALEANALQHRLELQQEYDRMNEEYEQHGRDMAGRRQLLRQRKTRVQILEQNQAQQPRSDARTPLFEGNRSRWERLQRVRSENDAAERQLTARVKRRCGFLRKRGTADGLVQAQPVCKAINCTRRRIAPGEKFFHCCFCDMMGKHKYHHCRRCGDQCRDKEHGNMFELQVCR